MHENDAMCDGIAFCRFLKYVVMWLLFFHLNFFLDPVGVVGCVQMVFIYSIVLKVFLLIFFRTECKIL